MAIPHDCGWRRCLWKSVSGSTNGNFEVRGLVWCNRSTGGNVLVFTGRFVSVVSEVMLSSASCAPSQIVESPLSRKTGRTAVVRCQAPNSSSPRMNVKLPNVAIILRNSQHDNTVKMYVLRLIMNTVL